MDDIKRMLYLQQKFMILSLFTNDAQGRSVHPAYAFAWSEGVYPFLDSAGWHEPYEDFFAVRNEQIDELHAFLADRWDAKKPLTFYELERHYGIGSSTHPGPVWSRSTLIRSCRYIYLHEDNFDQGYWNHFGKDSNWPVEAHSILRRFTPDDVYFS